MVASAAATVGQCQRPHLAVESSFLYESRLTSYCVQQAYIASLRNPMLQDSIHNAPYHFAKSFGTLQILNSDPQCRKINKAEGQPPLELSGTC